MDGIANVARQQQSQISPQEAQGRVNEQIQTTQQISQSRMKQDNSVAEVQKSSSNQKMDSQKDVEDLVKELNKTMEQLNPNIKFGVDQNDIFYVAAIDVKTNKVIRRYPAEEAQSFLPKMKEVSGILFDSKG